MAFNLPRPPRTSRPALPNPSPPAPPIRSPLERPAREQPARRVHTAWPSISLDRRALQDLPCRIRVLRPLPFAARSKDPLTESSGPSHSQPARKTRSRATRSPCPHRRALHSHSQSQRDSDAPPRVIRPISSGDLHTNKVPPRSSHPPRRSLNTKAKERRQSSTPPVRSSTRTPPITQPKRRGSPTGS